MTCKTFTIPKKEVTPLDVLEKKRELQGAAYVAYDVLTQLLPLDGSWQRLTTNEIISYTAYTCVHPIRNALAYLVNSGHIQRQRQHMGQAYKYKLTFQEYF